MRIISGIYRGTKIPSPKEEIVKPTLDRVKENVFNILQFKVPNSTCLDLFCGSGALGLECLSRGANHVVFNDNNKQNILSLKKFLEGLNAKNYTLKNEDYFEVLKQSESSQQKYDIIFLDPPFDSNLAEIAIQKILKFNLLSGGGLIVWEHPADVSNQKFAHRIKDFRKYGKIQIDFIG